ncbi:NBS-LRR disease resistance protein, partial [Trifolium medium]|nr:NBS-LRR disease resistance protein [Trifolium medium]
MWVCVSDNFEVKTILKNMLQSLTKNEPADTLSLLPNENIDDKWSLDNLQNKLRDNLT